MTREPRRIGWLLTVEPLGLDRAAWSLLRDDGTPVRGPVGAGLREGLAQVRRFAEEIPPRRAGASGSLWTGPLVDREVERWGAVRMGEALLPLALRRELLAADERRARHTVTVACRGWPAQVPWEALALDATGDVRLVERARVAAGLSPAVNAGRRRSSAWRRDAPALRIIDPGPTGSPFPPLYPGDPPQAWDAEDLVGPDDVLEPDVAPVSADRLGRLLSDGGWGRLVYLGHAIAGTADTPAGAALVLSRAGRVDRLSAHSWLAAPDRWPAPARVAIIACGSDDSLHLEQSGLPVAAVNAGADLLTVTRWSLPTDAEPGREEATTELAIAVDTAHRADDPLAALRSWQSRRLADWRATGARRHSPLLWASLATYVVPPVVLQDAP